MKIQTPSGYRPTDHDEDEYMNESQKESFRRKLQEMKEESLQEKRDYETLELGINSDQTDSAYRQFSDDTVLKAMNCLKKLKEIDSALERIENDTYGYCENTGDKIGIKRLEAFPLARFCVEIQDKLDREQSQKSREED